MKKINNPSLIYYFLRIINHLKRKRRLQLFGLLIIMLLSAILEMISIASIIPFLNIITSSNNAPNFIILRLLGINLENFTSNQFIFSVTIFFCLIILLTAFVRIINIWLSAKMAAFIGSDLSCEAFNKSIRTPYLNQINRNSSLVVNTITSETHRSVTAINGYLQIISGIILSLGIIFSMFFIATKETFIVAFSFFLSYLLMAGLSKNILIRNSKNVTYKSEKQVKAVNEGLGAIRDIILDDKYSFYLREFSKVDLSMRLSQASNRFFSTFPRYALEGISLFTIALLASYLVLIGEQDTIGIIGVIALGSQRLLPSLQLIFNGWASIKSFKSSLDRLFEIVEIKEFIKSKNTLEIANIRYKNTIKLHNICFRYSQKERNVLEFLNLEINKGDRVGILGETGSGKSTFIDLFLGLLIPNKGSFELDSLNLLGQNFDKNIQSWQKMIAHVPQSSYLLDASFKANIAFGLSDSEIDFDKVKNCAEIAKISSFIENTRYSYETIIGERGILLSGGQRQRIAIARALYQNKEILVLDEATSALDSETEKKVIENIYKKNSSITIIMIAHRLNTLYNCNKLYLMKDKKLQEMDHNELSKLINK